MEHAALAMGLGDWSMMRLIIMPQALRIAIPGIVNNFNQPDLVDTTLVAIVGLYDFLNIVRAGSRTAHRIGTEIEALCLARSSTGLLSCHVALQHAART